MAKEILAALIAAVATLIATPFVQNRLENLASSRMRSRSNIPEIMDTKWKAEWNYDDGSPPLKDIVTFGKWTKNSQFEGFGEITYDKLYKYSITGEVSPTRVVVLTYKAERYPTEGNIGTAILMLSHSTQELTGTWVGFEAVKQADGAETFKLRGGRVAMQRVKG